MAFKVTATKGRVIGPKSNLRMENLNTVDQGEGSGNSTPQFTFLYPLISQSPKQLNPRFLYLF